MRALGALLLAAAACTLPAVSAGQDAPTTAPGEPEEATLGLEASLYAYFPSDGQIYGQPTVAYDRGALHLETRYNYEGLKTGSFWVGWNTSFGGDVQVDATLMAGGVVGDEIKGVAPGYRLTVAWKKLELYSEGEYVVDVNHSENDFLYNWAQLGFYPLEWLSVGFASQRTRIYQTGLDVQRGPYIGFSMHGVTMSVYVFNPDRHPTVVAALAGSF